MKERPLKERVSELITYISEYSYFTERNEEALEIYEGDLLNRVLYILKQTLSDQYYSRIKDRVIPINFMPKIINKMSQTYSIEPLRTCSNQSFVDDYSKWMAINAEMSLADEYSNLHKGYALEPFIDAKGKPSLRALPFNRFLVKNEDVTDRRRPTTFIKFMGDYDKIYINEKTKEQETRACQWYLAYTDSEIMAFDIDEDLIPEVVKDVEGINPVGRIPFVYGNRSKQRLIPTPDTDLIQMILMFPVVYSDLGGAVMFQCFTIMYGVDVDTSDLKWSPNAFWDFKSDPKAEGKQPKIGTVKPEADVDKVLSFLKSLMSAWFESRSIKIGSIGDLDAKDLASGVSKVIDEADTTELRSKAIPFFKKEEKDLWELLAIMNNLWIDNDEIDTELYPVSKVNVKEVIKSFNIEHNPPKPTENRGEIVNTQDKEVKAKFTTRKRAIQKINPDLSETEVEALLKEIEQEENENIEKALKAFENNNEENNQEGEDQDGKEQEEQ